MMQLNHYNSSFRPRKFPITVVCDNVTNPTNIGSLFRTCDAFGVEKLIFCGDSIPFRRKMMKSSRATEKKVLYEKTDDILDTITNLKRAKYYLISLEITSKSKTITNFCFPKDLPIALVIGNENFGISDGIITLCDDVIHIPMYGQNSSMNVVQAANILLYEITKQLI